MSLCCTCVFVCNVGVVVVVVVSHGTYSDVTANNSILACGQQRVREPIESKRCDRVAGSASSNVYRDNRCLNALEISGSTEQPLKEVCAITVTSSVSVCSTHGV